MSRMPANSRELNCEHPFLLAQFKRANDGGVVVESSLRGSRELAHLECPLRLRPRRRAILGVVPVSSKPHDRLARQGPFLAHRAFLLEKVAEKADITMPELAAELAAATCQKVDPASLSRWLIRIGYRFKNVWPAPSAREFVEISC